MKKKFEAESGEAEAAQGSIWEDTWIPAICEGYCSDNPCALRVHRVNGLAVGIEPNTESEGFENLAKNRGTLCSKAYSYIQKLYNPHRIKRPLKRTNPEKGQGIDPKWVSISWDEAFDIIAEKLKEIRAEDTSRVSHGGPGLGAAMRCPAWWAFFPAYGHTQQLWGGRANRCEAGEHLFAQRIHGGFQCEPDLDYCNYLIIFGNNTAASGGATEGVLFADARERGMKIVVIDPVLSPTAAKATEWLPIKPCTDTAFLLAMINIIVWELGIYDEPFLKHKTNSPYLVNPDRNFVRDKTTGKIMVWDSINNKAKSHDDSTVKDFALEGTYKVGNIDCKPAFQVLKEHVKQYTPEWASSLTDIPADTIRRITKEFVESARIGSTIEVGNLTMPYRPAATKMGRGISGVMRSYQTVIANHILAALIGSIEVVGGHMGGTTFKDGKLRHGIIFHGLEFDQGIVGDGDGMTLMHHFPFIWPPRTYGAQETLCPFNGEYPYPEDIQNADPNSFGALQMDQLAWRNLLDPPKGLPVPPPPKFWLGYRTNPLLALGEPQLMAEAMKKIPFIVTISYTLDDVTEFADVVLPEQIEMERYFLDYRIRSACHKKYFMIVLQQPVIEPLCDVLNPNDIFVELADRLGLTDEFNSRLNKVLGLQDPYKLEPGIKYSWVDIVDRQCKTYTNGAYDLEWFKKNGGVVRPVSVEDQYDIHLVMEEKKLRYHVPYLEEVKRTGEELSKNLARVGIDWWSTEEYVALPKYIPTPLEEEPAEYDFYATTCRTAMYGWGNNVDNPWMTELIQRVRGMEDILMNEETAKARGIKEGTEVWVESRVGRVKRKVKLCQGIRPDVLLIAGQFGQRVMPVAKDSGRVTLTTLVPVNSQYTDHVTSGMQGQVIKVKIYKSSEKDKEDQS